jgi:hypothetical protein
MYNVFSVISKEVISRKNNLAFLKPVMKRLSIPDFVPTVPSAQKETKPKIVKKKNTPEESSSQLKAESLSSLSSMD